VWWDCRQFYGFAVLGAADAVVAGRWKIRLYLRQIPQGMANLHQTAFFVSQITALTRKPAQYPARERKLKLAQVLRFNSILRITHGGFMTTTYNDPIFGYSQQKASFSKMNAICFMAPSSVTEITQHLHKQEMVSRCTR
jgi:hypothetical protein